MIFTIFSNRILFDLSISVFLPIKTNKRIIKHTLLDHEPLCIESLMTFSRPWLHICKVSMFIFSYKSCPRLGVRIFIVQRWKRLSNILDNF